MTYPNPAGYYLPLPETYEAEIRELQFTELAVLTNNITFSLTPCGGDDIVTDDLSIEADQYLNSLTTESRISLIRWLSERLSYLANPALTKS